MLVIRRLFGTGTNCIAPSGLPLLLCLFPGLAPWAFLSRPCGASFAPETSWCSRCGKPECNLESPSQLGSCPSCSCQTKTGPAEYRTADEGNAGSLPDLG